MAFEPGVDRSERVERTFHVDYKKERILRLVLTDQRAFWPGKRFFAVADAVTTEQAAIHEIAEIRLGSSAKLPWVLTGGASVLAGIGLLCLFAWGDPSGPVQQGKVENMSFLKFGIMLTAVGAFIVLGAGSRRRIAVVMRPHIRRKGFRFVSPTTIGQELMTATDDVMKGLFDWAKAHSIPVAVQGLRSAADSYTPPPARTFAKGSLVITGFLAAGVLILGLMAAAWTALPPRDRRDVEIAMAAVAGIWVLTAFLIAARQKKNPGR